MNAENSTNKKMPPLQKRTVAVLNDSQMMEVNGGSTFVCAAVFAGYSSEVCAGVLFTAVVLVTDTISR
jgi:hypothetical protein